MCILGQINCVGKGEPDCILLNSVLNNKKYNAVKQVPVFISFNGRYDVWDVAVLGLIEFVTVSVF